MTAVPTTNEGAETAMSEHELKVVPPYFDALVSGSKTFEVRKNDRAYQRGDVLRLREWHPAPKMGHHCDIEGCDAYSVDGAHFSTCREIVIREVTFVYAGDPRFGGLEPGHVVLGLRPLRVAAVSS